jgi:hypothetical protein
MPNLTNVSIKLAAAVLLHDREISVIDIRALPFVESDEDVQAIVGALSRVFVLDTEQRRGTGGAVPFWEDVLRLRDTA